MIDLARKFSAEPPTIEFMEQDIWVPVRKNVLLQVDLIKRSDKTTLVHLNFLQNNSNQPIGGLAHALQKIEEMALSHGSNTIIMELEAYNNQRLLQLLSKRKHYLGKKSIDYAGKPSRVGVHTFRWHVDDF